MRGMPASVPTEEPFEPAPEGGLFRKKFYQAGVLLYISIDFFL
jgi:hypothetical protein